jgi:anti-sigma regulatory factor (Ser/Thr protein kinase)
MASHELRVEPQVSEIPRLLDWVAACCGGEGVGDDIRYKMMLALEEAVTNVIDHAFGDVPPPHLIRVQLEITAKTLVAEIIDNGHPFDPTGAPDPDLTLPLEQRTPGGLGVHLMRNVMDRLHYHRDADGNVLRLEKAR